MTQIKRKRDRVQLTLRKVDIIENIFRRKNKKKSI